MNCRCIFAVCEIPFLGNTFEHCIFKKWKLFNLKYLWTGAITGAFLGFAYIFQTIGLKHTTPGTNAFLTTVYCVIVPFLSWVVSKKRPDIYNFIAAAICITGIGLVCLDGKMSFSFLGEGFTLICGIFYALQIVAVENGAVISTLFFIRLYSSLPHFLSVLFSLS